MTTFVLVHGAWHDGSCWNDVIAHLEHRGHTAFAPTMAGRSEGAATRISHSELRQPIVDFILERALTDFVLVGHSYAGSVINKVVEDVSDRVRCLVYVDAFVLDDGESVNDVVPPHYRQLFSDLAKVSTDETVRLPFDVWRAGFINDGDDELARSTYERLCPEPYAPIIERLDFTKFYSLPVPKSYILGDEDIGMPEGDQWGWRPRFTDRLGDHQFVEICGGHETVFTNPKELAQAIIEAGLPR